MVENFGREGDVDYWKTVRFEIREEVLGRGFDVGRGHFKRSYTDPSLDASLLLMPLVGFIDANDPRMVATIEGVQRDLVADGLVYRYRTTPDADGLPAGEGAFLMCSFWLVDCLELIGRHEQAERLFERLVSLSNDLGLLAEQYDPRHERLLGNFPQAFSHVALATSALGLERGGQSPAFRRGHFEYP